MGSTSKVVEKAGLLDRLHNLRSTKPGLSYTVKETAVGVRVIVITPMGGKAEFSSKSNTIESLRDFVPLVEETLLKTGFIERKVNA